MAAWNDKKVEDVIEPKKFDPDLVFKPAIEIEEVKSLFMSIYGDSGVGKTHFVLTAKPPIYILDSEMSSPILIKQLPKELQSKVFVVNLLEYAGDISNGITKNVNNNILDAIYGIVGGLVETRCNDSNERGTIVIDSMSDVYSWLQTWLFNLPDLKRIEKTGEMMPTEWARLDKKWKDLFFMIRKSGWNVVLTFKPKTKWIGGKPSEEKEAKWKSGSLHEFDLHLEIERLGINEHRATIKKTRFGDDTFYKTFTNPTWYTMRDELSKMSGVMFE